MTLRRGRPDSNTSPSQVGGTQVDTGLAAEFSGLGLSRVNSIGRPYLFDDFGGGLNGWSTGSAGVGANALAYGLNGYAASQCARLDAGASGAGYMWIAKPLVTLPSFRIGIECAFFVANGLSSLNVDLFLNNTLNGSSANLHFDGGIKRWQILNGANVMQTINGIAPHVNQWNTIKVTVDTFNLKYIMGIVPVPGSNATITDLSAIAAPVNLGALGLAGLPEYSFGLAVTGLVGVSTICDLGYILLTTDEP